MKKTTKLMSVLLTLAVLLAAVPLSASAAEAYVCEWDGYEMDSLYFSQTEAEAAHTLYECYCGYSFKEYESDEVITLKLYSASGYEWEESALIVYVNGTPINLIRNMDGSACQTFAMPYDKNSSYVFKWINAGNNEGFGVEIFVPGSETPVFKQMGMSGYEMLETVCTVNLADYSAADAALAEIPEYLEYYSADSVATLVTAVKGVERMLSSAKQAQVDAMAAAVEAAVDGLVAIEEPVAHGVINMSSGNYVYINDDYYSEKPGYVYDAYASDEIVYEYDGDYVILETQAKDEGDEDYVKYGFYVYDGEVEIDLVNTFITGYNGNFGVYGESKVTLNLIGDNAFACYDAEEEYYSGIDVEQTAKLRIKGDGSLVAIGEDNQAGIGGWYEYYDDYDKAYDNGDVVIDSGTIFALSTGDGAGIGGAYKGGAGTITINGGRIWAECMSDDGAGIGVGDDGIGGKIFINGGDITALSVDDDGAGIGGADSGYVDSITINGGKIVAGSDDAAAIGGGQESESYGGKIIINGGQISASVWHDSGENLIGNGDDESVGETVYNFVQINGGGINASNSAGISPAPKTATGAELYEYYIIVHESLVGGEVEIQLSDGTTVTVPTNGTEIVIYTADGVTVTNELELYTGYCTHICHRDGFLGFIWSVISFLTGLFGITTICDCGMVH